MIRNMISKAGVEKLLQEILKEGDFFLVDVTVSRENAIRILIDHQRGITIEECALISRRVYGELDREQEDFSLQVSSPGLDEPLKVRQQYIRSIGRSLKIVLDEGTSITGRLSAVDENELVLETGNGKKGEGRTQRVALGEIKSAKVIVQFK